jgi:hypothetical protein
MQMSKLAMSIVTWGLWRLAMGIWLISRRRRQDSYEGHDYNGMFAQFSSKKRRMYACKRFLLRYKSIKRKYRALL